MTYIFSELNHWDNAMTMQLGKIFYGRSFFSWNPLRGNTNFDILAFFSCMEWCQMHVEFSLEAIWSWCSCLKVSWIVYIYPKQGENSLGSVVLDCPPVRVIGQTPSLWEHKQHTDWRYQFELSPCYLVDNYLANCKSVTLVYIHSSNI